MEGDRLAGRRQSRPGGWLLWREMGQVRLLDVTTLDRGQAHKSPTEGERGDGGLGRGQEAPRCCLLKLHRRADCMAGWEPTLLAEAGREIRRRSVCISSWPGVCHPEWVSVVQGRVKFSRVDLYAQSGDGQGLLNSLVLYLPPEGTPKMKSTRVF